VRKKIYVAGPISKGNLHANVKAAHAAGLGLLRAGFAPLVPHGSCFWGSETGSCGHFAPEATHSGISHDEWLEVDFAWVAVADGVLRLPGESVGADREVEFAMQRGIPAFGTIDQVVTYFGRGSADARPADAGAAASGASPAVGGNGKARTWEQRLERSAKITATELLMKLACQQYLDNFNSSPEDTIGFMTGLASAAEIFFEHLDEDQSKFRETATAMLRAQVLERAKSIRERIEANPLNEVLYKVFG